MYNIFCLSIQCYFPIWWKLISAVNVCVMINLVVCKNPACSIFYPEIWICYSSNEVYDSTVFIVESFIRKLRKCIQEGQLLSTHKNKFPWSHVYRSLSGSGSIWVKRKQCSTNVLLKKKFKIFKHSMRLVLETVKMTGRRNWSSGGTCTCHKTLNLAL
jgi:hypothetical protein